MARDRRGDDGSAQSRRPNPLEKIRTYIEGLDPILAGGIPAGRTTLILGSPGSGKTILGVEALYRAALRGERGIFLGFEESPDDLRINALTLGMDLSSLEERRLLFILDGHLDPEVVISGEFTLEPLLISIAEKAGELEATRIVIDALDVLLRLFGDPQKVRTELHRLNHWLRKGRLTSILTLKPGERGETQPFLSFFDSAADCVIRLDARVRDQVSTRRLRILKYRGSGFGRNEYPYVVSSSGIRMLPISSVDLNHQAFAERASSGVPGMDALLGGGYFRGSCVLIAGEPGTGKTILCSSFVGEACSRGERALYVSYEESEEALVRNVSSAGIQLDSHRRAGKLRLMSVMPESSGAEEHLFQLLWLVEEFRPDHVIIDAISACSRMGGQQASYEFLMRLINALKDRGITCLLTNQTSGDRAKLELSGNGISSMVDTVISVAYAHGDGETNRTLQVLKSRGSGHSNQVREFRISSEGIRVFDSYMGPGGVMTGAARLLQETRDTLRDSSQEMEIQAKQKEIERLKSNLESEVGRLRAQVEKAEMELAGLKLRRENMIRERDLLRRIRGRGTDTTNQPVRERNGHEGER